MNCAATKFRRHNRFIGFIVQKAKTPEGGISEGFLGVNMRSSEGIQRAVRLFYPPLPILHG